MKVLSCLMSFVLLMTSTSGIIIPANAAEIDKSVELSITDLQDNEITNLEEGQTIKLNVTADETVDGTIITSAYKNGTLLWTKLSDGSTSYNYNIDSEFEDTYFKVMLWDMEKLQPNSLADTVYLKEYNNDLVIPSGEGYFEDFESCDVGDTWGVSVSSSSYFPRAVGQLEDGNKYFGLTKDFYIKNTGSSARNATKNLETAISGKYLSISMDLWIAGNDSYPNNIDVLEFRSSNNDTLFSLQWSNVSSSPRAGIWIEGSGAQKIADESSLARWITFKAVVDMEKHNVSYTEIAELDGKTVSSARDISFTDETADDINKLYVLFKKTEGTSAGAFFIDNISIKPTYASGVFPIIGDDVITVPAGSEAEYTYTAYGKYDGFEAGIAGPVKWTIQGSHNGIWLTPDATDKTKAYLTVTPEAALGDYVITAKSAYGTGETQEKIIKLQPKPEYTEQESVPPYEFTEDFENMSDSDSWGARSSNSVFKPQTIDSQMGTRYFSVTSGAANETTGATEPTTVYSGAGTRTITKTFDESFTGQKVALETDIWLDASSENVGHIDYMTLKDNGGRDIFTLAWNNKSGSAREGVYIENDGLHKIGSMSDELRAWAKLTVIMDFETKKIDYISMRKNGEAINPEYVAYDLDFINKSAEDISSFYVEMARGGYGAFALDNFKLLRVFNNEISRIDGTTELEIPFDNNNYYTYTAYGNVSGISGAEILPAVYFTITDENGVAAKGLSIIETDNVSSVKLAVAKNAMPGKYKLSAKSIYDFDIVKTVDVEVLDQGIISGEPVEKEFNINQGMVQDFEKLSDNEGWGVDTNASEKSGVYTTKDGSKAFGMPKSEGRTDFGATTVYMKKAFDTPLTEPYANVEFDIFMSGSNSSSDNHDRFSVKSSDDKEILALSFNSTSGGQRSGIWIEGSEPKQLYTNDKLDKWYHVSALADLTTKEIKKFKIEPIGLTEQSYEIESIPFIDENAEDIGMFSAVFPHGNSANARGAVSLDNINIAPRTATDIKIYAPNEIGVSNKDVKGYILDAVSTFGTDKEYSADVLWSVSGGEGIVVQKQHYSNKAIMYVYPGTKAGDYTVTAYNPYDLSIYASKTIKFTAGELPIISDNYVAPSGARQMEYLSRGAVAFKQGSHKHYISWRSLAHEDYETVGFNIYRNNIKLNTDVIYDRTNFIDDGGVESDTYTIVKVKNGNETTDRQTVTILENPYIDIPLGKPSKSELGATYSPSNVSVGDFDGDGEYDFVVKWSPSDSRDSSQSGRTSNVYIDGYKMDGTRLWRIDLGRNIRSGAHYTPYVVYDFDGDGKSELAIRTANGTRDGKGNLIAGDTDTTDYSLVDFRCQVAHEYLTVFSCEDGSEIDSIPYFAPSGAVIGEDGKADKTDVTAQWGDENRADRFLACVAYTTQEKPSIVMCRGYYSKTAIASYNLVDGKLEKVWEINSSEPEKNVGGADYSALAGQGNHNLSVGDVDDDGCDEIIYGAAAVDHNGKLMYSIKYGGKNLGHGDAIHLADHIPSRPGLEVVGVHEDRSFVQIHDAKTGEIIDIRAGLKDVGRGVGADIDPRYEGSEIWAGGGVGTGVEGTEMTGVAGTGSNGFFRYSDGKYTEFVPKGFSMNYVCYWDGDLVREFSNGKVNSSGTSTGYTVDKYNTGINAVTNLFTSAPQYITFSGTKATPALQADILGDWREEIILGKASGDGLRIYMTDIPSEYRVPTLMHDSVYRLAVAWQNVGYCQPPHLSYYLGGGTFRQPKINKWYYPTVK